MLFGGADLPQKGTRTRRRLLNQQAGELIEELGLFATTPDGLPHIGPHRRYPPHLFALGYGGNGMTFGFLAAGILLRRLMGETRDGDDLLGFGRTRSISTAPDAKGA